MKSGNMYEKIKKERKLYRLVLTLFRSCENMIRALILYIILLKMDIVQSK